MHTYREECYTAPKRQMSIARKFRELEAKLPQRRRARILAKTLALLSETSLVKPNRLLTVGDRVVDPENLEHGIGEVLASVDCGEWGQLLTVCFENRGNRTIHTPQTPLKLLIDPTAG